MPKNTIKSSHLVGFAAEKSEAGSTVKIYTKVKLSTSNDPIFHVWMKHITGLFLPEAQFPVISINKFLIVLHSNDEADIYINDFAEISTVKVKKGIQEGEKVFVDDISEITDLKFQDIEIKKDDVVIYGLRTEWRFSLYFDFNREIDLEMLSKELGELKAEAIFYSRKVSTSAQSALAELNHAKAIILTEGKTDWKHLSKAADKLAINSDIAFFDDDKPRGGPDLLQMCRHFASIPQKLPMIFVFDRDDSEILKKLNAKNLPGKAFQEWGNNVYSFAIPVPSHREENEHAISIESFYKDDEIIRKDPEGRRLFLSNEFNKKTGNHNTEQLHCTALNKINYEKIGVIDSGVFNKDNNSVALSKDSFAEAIYKNDNNFNDFNHSEFKPIFDTIDDIINLRIQE